MREPEVMVFSSGSGRCPSSLVAAPFLLLLWVTIFFYDFDNVLYERRVTE